MLSNIVEVIKLNKYYSLGKEKFHALKDVNLEIEQGDFVMIMGKSGSGKTTLMNLLGLLDSFEDGIYKFNNIDVSKLKEDQKADIRNKYMGFIFQQFHLINSMTIGRNVELPLLYNEKSMPRKKREELIDKYLEMVGLSEKKNQLPLELSGGQQQRVAIARALINNPYVIFADEPTGALDSNTSTEIMEILKRLNEDNKTIIMVTHDEDLTKYANKIIRVKDGVITKGEDYVSN
ncbi:ABC transporter ATP-binding protein [Clostridium perfringens]|uniref:ABC transporter ATP-binding protein n=1 Tax=Clostridium perfringens TaxID=1502 RepID=UPI000DA34E4E|nr:ABC transporter ATP-binding protein [Clostridium perfringens]MDH5079595.1 Macrolide export ATP-binding/permease protein MacB [Clostridium perfringens]SQG39714.1 ABC transporter [Clostridium perfringens]